MLFLSIPDRRYTFDISRSKTSIGELLDNYRNQIKFPKYSSIIDHLFEYRKIVAKDVWFESDLKKKKSERRMTLKSAIKRANSMYGEYHSLHCNVFTYESFLNIFNVFQDSEIIPWRIFKSKNVQIGGNEFMVLLKKNE
jgi:hypothetical protein